MPTFYPFLHRVLRWTKESKERENTDGESLLNKSHCPCSTPTVDAESAPEWIRLQDIETGYRDKITFSQILCSLFSLHNETLNIWTHLAVAGYFFFQFLSNTQNAEYLSRPEAELFCIQLFLISAQGCHLISVIYHLFNCYSESVCRQLFQLDLHGIDLIITGSFIPVIYLGFECFLYSRGIYLVIACMVFIVGIVAAGCFHQEKHANIKNAILTSCFLFYLVPLAHIIIVNPLEASGTFLVPFGYSVLYLAVGFGIYLSRCPESIFPGQFDIFFSSHQLWHVCTSMALMIEYAGLLRYWDYISEHRKCS